MKLNELLKEYRRTHSLSLQDFATRSGLTKQYISMLENNKNSRSGKPISPSLDTLKKIATGMNISVDELMKSVDSESNVHINSTAGSHLPVLSPKDERDIQKKLTDILEGLDSNLGIAFYNDGEEMDDETRELVKAQLEITLRLTKKLAKQKFTPKKYKMDKE